MEKLEDLEKFDIEFGDFADDEELANSFSRLKLLPEEEKEEEEVWKICDFVEFGENYEISKSGEIRNIQLGRILKQSISLGYKIVYFNDKIRDFSLVRKKRKKYLVHRLLAIAFIENPLQKLTVDHFDRNRQNNILSNLRWANMSEQGQNKSKKLNTSSIYRGVYCHKRNQKWMARINIDGKQKYLGIFVNEVDAAKKYNEFCFSEFHVKNIFEEKI
jgi:hypothetical protein